MGKKIAILLDRERYMRLDLNAMSEFEDLTGKSLFNIGNDMQSAKSIRALLFCALKSGGEQLTIDEVGDLITMDNFTDVSNSLSKLMNKSYGDSVETLEGKK